MQDRHKTGRSYEHEAIVCEKTKKLFNFARTFNDINILQCCRDNILNSVMFESGKTERSTNLNVKVLDGFSHSLIGEVAQAHSFHVSLRDQALKYSTHFLFCCMVCVQYNNNSISKAQYP